MKKNVYLFEINDVIANQMKLPYSTGLIWSYCLEEGAVKENYQLAEWFYYRDDDKNLFGIDWRLTSSEQLYYNHDKILKYFKHNIKSRLIFKPKFKNTKVVDIENIITKCVSKILDIRRCNSLKTITII